MDLSQQAGDLVDLVEVVIRGLLGHRDLGLTAVATLSSLEREGPQRIVALTAAEGTTQPGMTQMIKRLQQRELVTVARGLDPDDRRATVAALTAQGRAALAAHRQRARQRIAGLLAELPEADVLALGDAVTAVLPGLRERVETNWR